MKIRTLPKQIQQTILAPTMQQSIEVLLLPLGDLQQTIEQELQDNPLLEAEEQAKRDEQFVQIEQYLKNAQKGLSNNYLPQSQYNPDDDREDKNTFANTRSLEDRLLQSLRLEVSDPLELKIGEFIIGDLDEDGYLKSSVQEIADELQIRDLHLIEQVLTHVQCFDPLGIAARGLKECLLIQAEAHFNGSHNALKTIIREHLDELGRRKYAEIARKLKLTEEKVKDYAQLIATLEPKPARTFRPITENIYVKPDVTITRDRDGNYHIAVHQEYLPTLRVNRTYQNLLAKPELSVKESEYIKERITSAVNFIKSIEQRSQTLRKISEYLLKYQKDFFEQGPDALRPMILKDVSVAIDRNESTICRAANNKYIDTPQGLFPLKYFFSQAINGTEGNGQVSNRRIKENLKELIESEDKSKPLSDQQIEEHFKKRGFAVARRTISKYRKNLNILPSNLRRN